VTDNVFPTPAELTAESENDAYELRGLILEQLWSGRRVAHENVYIVDVTRFTAATVILVIEQLIAKGWVARSYVATDDEVFLVIEEPR